MPKLLHGCSQRACGAGVVLNTSFNIHGEPLVCTPLEAVDVFLRSGADALALGSFLARQESADGQLSGTTLPSPDVLPGCRLRAPLAVALLACCGSAPLLQAELRQNLRVGQFWFLEACS